MDEMRSILVRWFKAGVIQVSDKLSLWCHALVYLLLMTPFAVFRHIRIHGDEKVYVGQALEMFRAGHLWQQLQFGEVNYIKGPLHYLSLILGHHLFGFSMLATVYMNLLWAALAVVALRAASECLLPRDRHLWAVPSWIFAASGAFVFFSFSSQMESQLTSLYAIALSLAVLAKHRGRILYFALLWASVGLAGALKSPLHSCLLGISVVAYFISSRSLWSELLSSPAKFSALAFGVLIGGAGYLLPYLADSERWLGTYMFREQIDRPRYADSAFGFLLNNFFLHVFPWSLLLVAAIGFAWKRARTKGYQFDELTRVGLAFLLPTFIFFFGLGYRAAWYGLPLVPALVMLLVSQLKYRSDPIRDIANAVLPWAAVMMAVVLICHAFFYEGTPWWSWSVSLVLSAVFLLAFLLLEAVVSGRKISVGVFTFAGVALFWCGVLGFSGVLGGAELSDVKSLLTRNSAPLNYSNTKKENYSEWGYMAYMTGQPTYFSNTFEELFKAGQNGHWLVFTKKEELNEFWDWMKSTGRQSELLRQPEVHLWRRWPRNMGQLKQLWDERASTENLWDKSARHFFVLGLKTQTGSVLAGP